MSKFKQLSRRGFLQYLTTAMGVTATTAAAEILPDEQPSQAESLEYHAKPASKGYQHTQHVDTYYQLADL